MVVNALTFALSPSSSPSTCVALQTLLLLGVSTFLSKISPPGPGLLIHDSTGRVPCLYNVSPAPPSHRILPSQSISTPPQLSSTCCVIVASPDGDGQAGTCVCKDWVTRHFSSSVPIPGAMLFAHAGSSCTVMTLSNTAFLRTHDQTHARSIVHPPNHA